MKTRYLLQMAALVVVSAFSLQPWALLIAAPMGTAFTYQGVATDNGRPATGVYDVQAALYDAPSGGSQIGATLNFPGSTTDNNGVFTVSLDFGSSVFNGQARWLEWRVRPGGSTGAYTILSPRQYLSPAPAALYAANAGGLAGALPSSQLSGTYSSAVTFNNGGNSFSGVFSGNGASLAYVNAATLGGLSVQNFWQLGGNAGTTPGANFLGTTDNQPLEFKVNNVRGLRLEPTTSGYPNVIGGAPSNVISNGAYGALIGGGYGNIIQPTVYTMIGGGINNTIQVNGSRGTIGGGEQNTIETNASRSTVGGGYYNTIKLGANYATIGGGYNNTIRGSYAAIPGGDRNSVTNYCFAAGRLAKAYHTGCFVWADSQSSEFITALPNQFLIRASGGVGINTTNTSGGLDVVGRISGTTAQSGGTAVYGWASSRDIYSNRGGRFDSSGTNGIGVEGTASGRYGIGVRGSTGNINAGANTFGGYFTADGISCTGVKGVASGPGGIGVFGYGGDYGYGVIGRGGANGYDFDAEGPGINYGSQSSIRWKRDIRLIGEPLDKLMNLRGVYFNWDAAHGGSHDVGMIAEEVGKVLPEIVGYETNGVDATGMDYSKLTPLLVEAGKALKTQVDELRQQMAQKDARIGALESKLVELETLVNKTLNQSKER